MPVDPVQASKAARAEAIREIDPGATATGIGGGASLGGASKKDNGFPRREGPAMRERSTTLMRGSRAVRNTVQVNDKMATAAERVSNLRRC